MNFLGLRSNQTAAPDQLRIPKIQGEANRALKSATLEGLISEDSFPESMPTVNHVGDGGEIGSVGGLSLKHEPQMIEAHVDVAEDEGWITIPCQKLPDNWRDVPDIHSFRSLDRFFVFPGEQLHILACLSASEQETEIITPFKVAAVMNKNGIGHGPKKENRNTGEEVNSESQVEGVHVGQDMDHNDKSENLVSSGESLLRMEDHRRQTEKLLQKFSNSHFFVRIAELDEPLWSKRRSREASKDKSELGEQKFSSDSLGQRKKVGKSPFNTVVDRGNFNSSTSGGVARDAVKCFALPNGDIVVLLKINISVDVLMEPVLEVLQFERHQERGLASTNYQNQVSTDQDPCGELLRWLLPLDNSIAPARSLSPLPMSSSASIRSTSTKANLSGSSESQLFSFGHFRSYSMSSLPQNTAPTSTVSPSNSRTTFNPGDWDHFSFYKSVKSEKRGREALLSFRGVPLEPERFSARCGLEGIYIPGRRWRRKIEIIQPVEISSFAVDCNTDDLLCVQIKNIAPAHAPDVEMYIDAITIVSEDASRGGLPSSFPIACIEAGNEHSLPNLTLRRGEEHSFILKPVISFWKSRKGQTEKNPQLSRLRSHSLYQEARHSGSSADLYAVLVSCRSNYTESRLFFKQPTSWCPRISRDLLISVASEMSKQTLGSDGRVAQLPVQVLTLQASNLTSEDLTLTVLAPASFTSPPSVVSLSSSPTSPISPLVALSEFSELASSDRQDTSSVNLVQEGEGGSRPLLFCEQALSISEILPSGDLDCTHLWLQSKVPLGCVPSHSTATIKLEVLPLTDGIITLDSLQIVVGEKGVTYIPEHSIKINTISSILLK